MKKLRLLITDLCIRSCEGCCNKGWDLEALPIVRSFEGYDEVIITGGEPLLKPRRVMEVVRRIREENPEAKIFLYTADVSDNTEDSQFTNLTILEAVDGMTLTLHDQSDVEPFLDFTYAMLRAGDDHGKSLRLNVFAGVEVPDKCALECWKVKDGVEWIKDCPLPGAEVFMRHEEAFL